MHSSWRERSASVPAEVPEAPLLGFTRIARSPALLGNLQDLAQHPCHIDPCPVRASRTQTLQATEKHLIHFLTPLRGRKCTPSRRLQNPAPPAAAHGYPSPPVLFRLASSISTPARSFSRNQSIFWSDNCATMRRSKEETHHLGKCPRTFIIWSSHPPLHHHGYRRRGPLVESRMSSIPKKPF